MGKTGRSAAPTNPSDNAQQQQGLPVSHKATASGSSSSSKKKWEPVEDPAPEDGVQGQADKKRRVEMRCELCERKPEERPSNTESSGRGAQGKYEMLMATQSAEISSQPCLRNHRIRGCLLASRNLLVFFLPNAHVFLSGCCLGSSCAEIPDSSRDSVQGVLCCHKPSLQNRDMGIFDDEEGCLTRLQGGSAQDGGDSAWAR